MRRRPFGIEVEIAFGERSVSAHGCTVSLTRRLGPYGARRRVGRKAWGDVGGRRRDGLMLHGGVGCGVLHGTATGWEGKRLTMLERCWLRDRVWGRVGDMVGHPGSWHHVSEHRGRRIAC